MDSVCRLCAEAKGPIDLIYKLDDLLERLVGCCQWKWRTPQNEAKLPQNVCDQCHDQLTQCWQFTYAVQNAQRKLDNWIACNDSMQIESEHVSASTSAVIKNEPADDMHELNSIGTMPDIKCFQTSKQSGQHIAADASSDESSPLDAPDEIICFPLDAELSPTTGADSHENNPLAQRSATLTRADYLALISDDARLDNGQVEPDKIVELQISDWRLFKYRCWLCDTLHDDDQSMQRHLDDRHPDDEHKWQCSLCPKTIEPSAQAGFHLRFHVVRSHYPHLNYCCQQCHVFFWDMRKKSKHLRTIHQRQARRKPAPTECRICNRVFPTHDTHWAHVRYEHRLKHQQFECYLCKKTFKRRHTVRFHMRQIHCIARAAVSQSRDFMCDLCGRAFFTKGQLKSHSQTHVIVDTLAFECDVCKQRYKSQTSLAAHKLRHLERKFHCDRCSYQARGSSELKKHQTIHAEKQLACEFCGKKFALTSTLKIHRRIHTGEKPFACALCEYRSVCGANLNKHMLQVHKERYYKQKVTMG